MPGPRVAADGLSSRQPCSTVKVSAYRMPTAPSDQFALLRQRRFAPFFWTQFAGAANDNLFKFAFTVLVTYQVQISWLPPALAGLVIGALFIAPFVLFSATAGQLCDRLEKTRIIRAVKNLEIAIMALAALGFLIDAPDLQAGLLLALLGRWSAQRMEPLAATDPQLRINWNPFSETRRNLRLAREDTVSWNMLLGISWLWFFGDVYLSQFPVLAKDVLRGSEHVASLLLVVFSIGIGAGALLCERLSRGTVEIGLVPLGALGMSVFTLDFWLATRGLPASDPMGLSAFVAQPAHWRVLLDLALLSMSAGLFSVPMYALIQVRSQPSHRSRIIAANNIVNALFMVASALISAALLVAGVSLTGLFLCLALGNTLMLVWLCLRVPELPRRAWQWLRRG